MAPCSIASDPWLLAVIHIRQGFRYNRYAGLDRDMTAKRLIPLLALLALVLGACQLTAHNPSPPGKPGALYTEAAQTLSVQQTASGMVIPDDSSQSGQELETTPAPKATSTTSLPSATPRASGENPDQPCDQVRFIKDVTIPDEMDLAPGEHFTKTWRLENAGSCPWTIGYLLYFESGDIMGGPSSQELTSETIQPGETIDISVELVAPQETGAYQGNWKLRNVKGEGFGVGQYSNAFWVKINVVEGAGMMFDFNARANEAAWGSGSTPVEFVDQGGKILNFDFEGDPGDAYVALLDQQFLEGGRISGILLASFPPEGKGKYIIGRFPRYKVNPGDLLFGRVGLIENANGNCGDGDVDYRIHLMQDGDPATLVLLWEWREICDGQLKSFEIDLDPYKGDSVQIFLVVIANTASEENLSVWDSLLIHR
jgi:hypothetical protein